MLKGRATLSLSMIPNEWAVERGYGQLCAQELRRERSRTRVPALEPRRERRASPPPLPLRLASSAQQRELRRWTADPQWTYSKGAGRTRAEQKATALRLAAVEQLAPAG